MYLLQTIQCITLIQYSKSLIIIGVSQSNLILKIINGTYISIDQFYSPAYSINEKLHLIPTRYSLTLFTSNPQPTTKTLLNTFC